MYKISLKFTAALYSKTVKTNKITDA